MKTATHTALCAALPVSGEADGSAPEWVHLLLAGEMKTNDNRGPYRVKSLQAIAQSLKPGDKLPIDENHSTDIAAPLGKPSPARGWIVELQARDDGLWGKVEWTPEGRLLVEGQAYRSISPVILLDRATRKNVLGVVRASLVNKPNLKGLTALHSEENGMDWKGKLIELMSLDSEADDDAVMTALSAKMKGGDEKPALQSVVETPEYVALQSQYTELATQFNAAEQGRARDRAVAFVDGALSEGRAGLNATVRDQYVELHMENPERAETMIGAMPKLSGETRTGAVAAPADGSGLSASDRTVMELMGLDEDEMKASLAAAGKQMETL